MPRAPKAEPRTAAGYKALNGRLHANALNRLRGKTYRDKIEHERGKDLLLAMKRIADELIEQRMCPPATTRAAG